MLFVKRPIPFRYVRAHAGLFWTTVCGADNAESVALGLARTGRVVTAVALLMAITFASMATAQVSLMRVFGVGLPLAVLADATLVRALLVPASMALLGRSNWWVPSPLVWLHRHIGINESLGSEKLARPASKVLDSVAAEAA